MAARLKSRRHGRTTPVPDALARDLDISERDAALLRQHGEVTRQRAPIADVDGRPAVPWRRADLLQQLRDRDRISAEMLAAAEDFRRLFRLALLDPLRAQRLEPAVRGRSRDPNRPEWARRQVALALAALGGAGAPAGSCLWYVVGCEHSVRHWALRQGWQGRRLRPEEANGVLIAALAILAKHFRRDGRQ